MGDPTICNLCSFDTGALLIGIAVGLALGIAAAVIRRRPAMPDDDPHARPFADKGGRRG